MQASYNSASLQLVYKESINLFRKIEVELEQYISNQANDDFLINTTDLLKQIRGTMIIVELPAAIILLDLAQELVEKLKISAEEEKHALLTSLCLAIAVIPRYLEFIQNKTNSLPYLLLPAINELRHKLSHKPIGLSYFFKIGHRPNFPLKVFTADKMKALKTEIPELLQRYQKSLLSILTFGPEKHALSQMQDVIKDAYEVCQGKPVAELWYVCNMVLEAFIDDSVKFTKSRRRLFAKIDHIFKALARDENNSFNLKFPDSVLKELLYVIALTRKNDAKYQRIKGQYKLSEFVVSEGELLQEYYNFKGPSADALSAAFEGLQDEVGKIIDLLNPTILKNGHNQETISDIHANLIRIGKSLLFLGRAEGDIVLRQIRFLGSISTDNDVNTNNKIVNAVSLTLTQINASLARAIADPFSVRKSPLDAEIIKGIRNESEKSGFEDARRYLKNIRNGLSDFIATRDPDHIRDVPGKLKLVCEGLTFIKIPQAPEILFHCQDFVENGLMNANNMVTGKQLTILADAITGIDYFLECRLNNQPIPNALLDRLEVKVQQISTHQPQARRA